eukprot:TRINITY_DN25320_c0_g1_i1.p1 TRINITY_DN25320_c0_g1~~TRINITY_DN25320_c0_g1_i1.p1  ORF type:complete len:228 (-),score=12.85 TRINITY_DN25320_c0_g1_i1:104-742(-)
MTARKAEGGRALDVNSVVARLLGDVEAGLAGASSEQGNGNGAVVGQVVPVRDNGNGAVLRAANDGPAQASSPAAAAPPVSSSGSEGSMEDGKGGAFVDAFAEFDDWQMQTVAMWQMLNGRRKVVTWLAVHCYDRTGLLAEVSKIVTDAGMLICTHAGRTNRNAGIGVMLFELDGPDSDLAAISNQLLQVDGVLSFALGCTLPNAVRSWPWTA